MRFYTPREVSVLTEVVDAKSFLSQVLMKDISPFKSIPFFVKWKIIFLQKVVDLLQRYLKDTLYIKNEIGELMSIDARFRGLLLRLSREKIIASFERAPLYPDAPEIVNFRITLAPILLPNGEQARINGSQGNGVGETLHDALVPALAEALERYATATWLPRDVVEATRNSLKNSGSVSVGDFNYFSSAQLSRPAFSRYRITDDTLLGWTAVHSLVTGKKHFVPAQLVYLFYDRIDKGSYFLQTTTNGVAAHTSSTQATYRAVCELIERDAVMIYWLNKLVPTRIDLDTITVPLVKQQIQSLISYGFEVHVLDLTSDLGVPVIGMILLDEQGTTGVSLTAACGFDVDAALQGAMFELLRFAHKRRSSSENSAVIEPAHIRTMKERSQFWSRPQMRQEIQFLLQGKIVSYKSLQNKAVTGDSSEYLQNIKATLRHKGYECYIKNISNPICKREGLEVVRVLVPQLVPLYFSEFERPYGLERLYTAPKAMGYQGTPEIEDNLNQVPHPFI